jgi:3-hydroxyacyl-[acyl-carrier-protein] dehydratase
VLMLEGMAQLAGLLLEASLQAQFACEAKAVLTVIERTKFREMIRPGDTLVYRADVTSVRWDGGKASARAVCRGREVVTTGLTFAFKHLDDPALEQRRAELLRTWLQPEPESPSRVT